ncbi:hypothetical protein MSS2_04250 [Mycobacterium marinum]|nr:hypothetical protein MSS2_04250 [Mycobacterium marinum]
MLEWAEGKLFQQHMPPDEVRDKLLKQAYELKDRALGDAVLAGVPQPTGAGYWGRWQFDDGLYTRDFEDRNLNVHDIEIQIVGTQTIDAWAKDDALSTIRKVRISGQAELTPDQAQEVAAAILSEAKRALSLDSSDNEA